jgi:hypothetical protein
MVLNDVFLYLALLSVVWGIVSAIVMSTYLSQRGVKINLLMYRIMVLKYIHQYHEITERELGRPGSWFYSYVISMNLALVLAIIGLIIRSR